MNIFEQWPAAYGPGVLKARFKATPEDFIVREWLGFEPDGEGDHMLLTVRKRGANSNWVAKQLARYGRIDVRDVGFSGMKDRQAVTEQAYSVPSREVAAEFWLAARGEGWEVIQAVRQRRKLKRGAHRANDFVITLTDVQAPDEAALEQRLQRIAALGVANYFGAQRFGREASNLRVAEQWFGEGRAPADRFARSFALSAARAVIFNDVLAARIRANSWNTLLDGDVANLNGSGSVFGVPTVDETLSRRCAEFDVHPTGTLWGTGELASTGAVAQLERSVAARHELLARGLEKAGLCQERRALRVAVRNFAWTRKDDKLILEFRLSKGSFATTLLTELLGDIATDCGEEDDA